MSTKPAQRQHVVNGDEPGARSRKALSLKYMGVYLAVLIVVGGIALISMTMPGDPPETPETLQRTAPAAGSVGRYDENGHVIPTPGGSGRPSTITNPEPWQFDPVSNQHWSASCWHWHEGPPPPPDQRGTQTVTTSFPTMR